MPANAGIFMRKKICVKKGAIWFVSVTRVKKHVRRPARRGGVHRAGQGVFCLQNQVIKIRARI